MSDYFIAYMGKSIGVYLAVKIKGELLYGFVEALIANDMKNALRKPEFSCPHDLIR